MNLAPDKSFILLCIALAFCAGVFVGAAAAGSQPVPVTVQP